MSQPWCWSERVVRPCARRLWLGAGAGGVLLLASAEFGDRPALIDGISGAKISFAELPGRVGGACAYLQSMG